MCVCVCVCVCACVRACVCVCEPDTGFIGLKLTLLGLQTSNVLTNTRVDGMPV